MNTQTQSTLPTGIKPAPATLAKATGGALTGAVAILVLFVLPAEYGIDPTGAGDLLGLVGMASAQGTRTTTDIGANAAQAAIASLPSKTSIARSAEWRQDAMTITLAPHSGKEVKAHMKQGDSFIFEWKSANGPVKVDMHGERINAASDEYTRYWEEREMTGARGDFTAPFEGTHGWYWRNKGDVPVTVTVKTAGFYKDLFQPQGE